MELLTTKVGMYDLTITKLFRSELTLYKKLRPTGDKALQTNKELRII